MAKRKKELLDAILKYINGFAAVGTMIATIALIWSNFQTKEQIGLQRDSVDLQRKSIESVDSNIVLLREQIDVQREAIETQRDFNAITQRNIGIENDKYSEQNKPIVYYDNPQCGVDGDKVSLHFTIINCGKSTASNLSIVYYTLGKRGTIPIDSFMTASRNSLAPGKRIVDGFKSSKDDFNFKIEIKWEWEAFGKTDSLISYRNVKYDKVKNTCASYLISEDDL